MTISKFKILNKVLSVLLCVALSLSYVPLSSLTAFAADNPTEKNITLGTSALKGGQASNVYFGRFQQSSLGKTEPTTGIEGIDWMKSDTAKNNNRGPYYRKDPIKWRVLSNANGKALLLSDKVLEQICFYDGISTRYYNSTIYRWMNGTGSFKNDSFIGSAFSESEKNVISGTSEKYSCCLLMKRKNQHMVSLITHQEELTKLTIHMVAEETEIICGFPLLTLVGGFVQMGRVQTRLPLLMATVK